MKIRPVGAELFRAGERTDGHTDMTELKVAFRNSADAPKIRERNRSLSITLLLLDIRCSCNYGASKNPYINSRSNVILSSATARGAHW